MVKTLGVMGLVAAGKSYFTEVIINTCKKEGIGYYHYDADKEAKKFMQSHKKEITKIFALDPNASDEEIKKNCYSAIFDNTDPEHRYRNYVWTELKKELIVKREEFESSMPGNCGNKGVFIINAPLLLSSGWYALCDTIAEVKTDSDVRIERFIARDTGLGRSKNQALEHFHKIESAYGEEKAVDRTQFRTIIYKINNTVAMVSNHLELEARVILDTVFEEE